MPANHAMTAKSPFAVQFCSATAIATSSARPSIHPVIRDMRRSALGFMQLCQASHFDHGTACRSMAVSAGSGLQLFAKTQAACSLTQRRQAHSMHAAHTACWRSSAPCVPCINRSTIAQRRLATAITPATAGNSGGASPAGMAAAVAAAAPQEPAYTLRVTAKDFADKVKLRLDAYLTQALPQQQADGAKSAAKTNTSGSSADSSVDASSSTGTNTTHSSAVITLGAVSRVRLAASIEAGLVQVNGRVVKKASHQLKLGDTVSASVLPPPPMTAVPEDLPLDIVYEDEHLMVVNKAPGMVVHVSAGHHSGTLVNALMHRLGMPAVDLSAAAAAAGAGTGSDPWVSADGSVLLSAEDADDDDMVGYSDVHQQSAGTNTSSGSSSSSSSVPPASLDAGSAAGSGSSTPVTSSGGLQLVPVPGGVLRPGIVHRLDKGTSGLMVVAKTQPALTALAAQFKERSVERTYWALTLGCPSTSRGLSGSSLSSSSSMKQRGSGAAAKRGNVNRGMAESRSSWGSSGVADGEAPSLASGRVETNIVRDANDRKRMAVAPWSSGRGKTAASNYTVLESLYGGRAALVQWQLDTGRTHQIRVHAKHLGHSLLNDDTYGCSATAALQALSGGNAQRQAQVRLLLLGLGDTRPALHALTLGFTHPATGKRMQFTSELEPGMQALLQGLRELS